MTMTMKPEVFSYNRWSSKPQALGDSERRQIEASNAWCARNGLSLSDRSFTDSGVSAKAGRNLEDGALGELTRTAKPGDIILIEDNDRFSRQDPVTALGNLSAIVKKGVRIVFLRTGVEVTQANFNDMSVIVPNFFGALLANQENVKKSERVRAAWVTKQAEIREGKAIRQRLPGWLSHEKTFSGGKTVLGAVKVDEAKAETVREIFKLTLAGWSRRRIAQDFNARKVPSVSGQAQHWNGQSLLACIVRNPAVIGDYRTSDGETIKGIFPRIVSDETFYAANASATGNQKRTTPKDAGVNNLVTGLIKCPTCGGNMRLDRKHNHGKVYSYLMCSSNKSGRTECDCRPNYDAFESSLLALLRDSATLQKALGQPAGEPTELAALRGKVQAADSKLNELMRLLEETPSKALALRVQALEIEAETARAELQTKEATAKATTPPSVAYENFRKGLAEHLNEPSYREQVKVALRDIIGTIKFETKTAYTVNFKGGGHMEVWMTDGAFNWVEAKTIGGPLQVL